ncbi:hypothetical protein V1477_009333 [Vespula maculifrons]|uniref:Uncharacterized protein n=1 Tax=Vespula maculifrons TaxID=7453 RepID=A0ABD2CAD5_VESMC
MHHFQEFHEIEQQSIELESVLISKNLYIQSVEYTSVYISSIRHNYIISQDDIEIHYDYNSVLPVYNDVELLHFQLTWISTYFIFNLLQIILLQCGVTWSTSVLEPSQNFLSSE